MSAENDNFYVTDSIVLKQNMFEVKTYPCLYNSSSSSRYPKDDTAGGTSTSFRGFGGSPFTSGFLYM